MLQKVKKKSNVKWNSITELKSQTIWWNNQKKIVSAKKPAEKVSAFNQAQRTLRWFASVVLTLYRNTIEYICCHSFVRNNSWLRKTIRINSIQSRSFEFHSIGFWPVFIEVDELRAQIGIHSFFALVYNIRRKKNAEIYDKLVKLISCQPISIVLCAWCRFGDMHECIANWANKLPHPKWVYSKLRPFHWSLFINHEILLVNKKNWFAVKF